MKDVVWWGFNFKQNAGHAVIGVHCTVMYADFFAEGFTHHEDFDTLPPNTSALVIINTATWYPSFVEDLNRHLDRLPSAKVFVVFNEDNHLDVSLIHCSDLWIQQPKPGLHDHTRRLPIGYSRWAKQTQKLPRDIDWFFSGRLWHIPEWQVAINRLEGGYRNEISISADGHHLIGGLDSKEYMRLMCSSKIAVCRPGNCTPESVRMYEALEAGCVPIVPRYPPEGHWKQYYGTYDYWQYLLGEEPAFPIIDRPEDLPSCINTVLQNWPQMAQQVSDWWTGYKTRLKLALIEDLRN